MTELITSNTPAISFLQSVTDSVIRLPALQRDFVWGDNNAKDLIDSIYRDFPIGNFYLWTPPAINESQLNPDNLELLENKAVHSNATLIGHNGSIEDLKETDIKYILDGQQRITTLYRIYNKIEGTNVYFQPSTEKFLAGGLGKLYLIDPDEKEYKSKKAGSIVSVHEVWNTSAKHFDKEWENSPFTKVEKERIKKLNKVLNSFVVDIHELRGHSLDQVIEIFKRINKTGKSLTWAESLAMPSLVRSVPSIKNSIETLRKSLNLTPSMEKIITIDFIAQAIIWAMDGYTKEVSTSYESKKIIDAFNTVSIGLREVLDILNSILGIKTKNMVGSGVPIIISSIAAGKTLLEANVNKKPNEVFEKCYLSDKDRARIALYYIASTTFGTYSQGSNLQADKKLHINLVVENLTNHCEEIFKLSQKILETAKQKSSERGNFISTSDLLEVQYSKGKSSPFFILLGIVLSDNHASNFITESHLIDFSNAHRHHIYPHSQFKNSELSSLKHNIGNITYISETANQEISNKLPKDYLLKNYNEEKLKRHLFPDEYANDISKMDTDSAKDFIIQRIDKIREKLNNFIFDLQKKAE